MREDIGPIAGTKKVEISTTVREVSSSRPKNLRLALISPQPFAINDVLADSPIRTRASSPATQDFIDTTFRPLDSLDAASRGDPNDRVTARMRVFPQWLKKEAFWLAFGVSGGVSAASAAMDLAVKGVIFDREPESAAGGALAVFGSAACFISTWAATADIGQVTGRNRRRLFLSASIASVIGVCVGHALHRWSENGTHAVANMTSVIPVMLGLGMLSIVVPEVFACSELVRGQVLAPSAKREQIRRATIALGVGILNAWATVDGTARYPRSVRIPIIALTTTALFMAEGISRADFLRRKALCGENWLGQTANAGRRSLIPPITALCAGGGKLVTAMSAASLTSSLSHHRRVIEGFSAAGVAIGMTAAIYAAWRFGNDVARAGRPDALRLKAASIGAAFLVAGGTVGQRYLSELHDLPGERAILLPILVAVATICYVLPEFFARSESVHGFALTSPEGREQFRRVSIAIGIGVNATWAHLAHNLLYPRALTAPLLAAATTLLLLGEAVGRSNAVSFEAIRRDENEQLALNEIAA